MSLPVVIGVGIVSFLLLMFSWQLKKREEEKQGGDDSKGHELLRLLTIIVAIGLLLFIPKSLIDEQTVCEVVVDNSTAINSSSTNYQYTQFCYERTDQTPEGFNKAVLWYYRIFIGYIVFYLGYLSMLALKDSLRGHKE